MAFSVKFHVFRREDCSVATLEFSSVGSLRRPHIWGFRIPDSRFRIPGSFPFGNPESRIGNPDWVAAEGRVRVFLRRVPSPFGQSGDSEFRIRDSGFPDHSPSGIRNRESGIPDWVTAEGRVRSSIFPRSTPSARTCRGCRR